MKVQISDEVTKRMLVLACEEVGIDPAQVTSLALESESGTERITWEGAAAVEPGTTSRLLNQAVLDVRKEQDHAEP